MYTWLIQILLSPQWNEKKWAVIIWFVWVDIYILFRTIQEREILLWPFKTWFVFDSVLIDRFIPFSLSHEVDEIPALLIKQNKKPRKMSMFMQFNN